MRRLAVLWAACLLAGCGTSSAAGTSARTTGRTSTRTALATTGTTAQATTSTTASRPAPPPARGGINVILLARFTIGAGGTLTPRTVAAPAGVAVELELISGDGRAHRVVLRTARPRVLHPPAGGRATVILRGLRDGRYAIDVDGKPRGALLVGAHPGP